ncbi:MAG: hypothetical protein WDZ37_00405 [Solirubrobacterales bacterium]
MSILRGLTDGEEERRSHTSEPYIPFRRQRPSDRLASGSLRCPTCDVPIVTTSAIPFTARMRCPFCRSIHPVRGFVQIGVHDTGLNAVELRARLPF